MYLSRNDRSRTNSKKLPLTPVSATLLGDLYEKLDLNLSDKLGQKGKVALCGQIRTCTDSIMDWLSQQNSQLVVFQRDSVAIGWLAGYAEQLDLMLVDADCMADLEEAVDFCLQIRQAAPGLKIILISSAVRESDLTCERMIACDVTLKWPVTKKFLALGVRAALENHASFMASRRARLGTC
ncbi:hypothetical protein [Roseobacter sp. N2S]|uniref:hypothetical protein n=1 Tax=Roseobacter sp. N2S TaxID=2663844 RepID=UPI0028556064|nr:hypothetical protein [Roseobacter sp. N2S]MDR6267720.1 hypothetical protein [Roseobacter sp. N2S]